MDIYTSPKYQKVSFQKNKFRNVVVDELEFCHKKNQNRVELLRVWCKDKINHFAGQLFEEEEVSGNKMV